MKTKRAIFLIILRPLICFINKYIFRVKYYGLDNIPEKGNFIFAGNHTSIYDCLLLVSAAKRPPYFLAKKELHETKIGNWFFRNCGTIPVDRSKKNPDVLKEAKKILNEGKIIAIFPEGTTNKTDNIILPFKYGAVKMSIDTNSRIIPFVIKGKYKFFKKGVSITFLKPLDILENITEYNLNLMNVIKKELENK